MNYGFVLPGGDARIAADFAYEAEQAGWDGFFVWEPVWGIDAWVSLTAAAMRTERIRLGTMLTPLAWTRPWKLASETVTLDHLSNGRVILSVGLGANDTGAGGFGLETDRKTKAGLVDEGLAILNGLWRGGPFNHDGKHYQIKATSFQPPPPPVQKPRIPIWAVGAWPRMKSMERVLRCDGLLPAKMSRQGKFVKFTPDDVREMRAFVEKNRKLKAPFDVVMEGETPGESRKRGAAKVRRWAEAGATWWIETRWETPRNAEGLKIVRQRLQQGPPRL